MGTPANASAVWRFGVFEADARTGELRSSGQSIKLREQPSRVLLILLEHAGELVTREQLRQRLWPADTFVDFDHTLNTAVMKLREALGDSADRPLTCAGEADVVMKHAGYFRFCATKFQQIDPVSRR